LHRACSFAAIALLERNHAPVSGLLPEGLS
jgi:hypothetical protein